MTERPTGSQQEKSIAPGVHLLQPDSHEAFYEWAKQTGLVPQGDKGTAFARWVELKRHPKTRPVLPNGEGKPGIEERRQRVAARLEERAKEQLYEAIRTKYNLPPETDIEQWTREKIRKANAQIDHLAQTVAPGSYDLTVSPELQLAPNPLELVGFLLDSEPSEERALPTDHPVTRESFEAERAIVVGDTVAELDSHIQQREGTFREVQKLLDQSLFKQTPTKRQTIYALHHNVTNGVLEIPSLSRDDTMPIDLPPDTHLKKHSFLVREVPEVGRVAYIQGPPKNNGAVKAMRKSQERKERGVDPTINTERDVPDIFRMKFVVTDVYASNAQEVNALIGKIEDQLIRAFGDQVHLEDKSKTGGQLGDPNKSRDLNLQRRMVKITQPNSERVTIEMMFHGMDFLDNDFKLGSTDEKGALEVDPLTGKPNGPAHKIHEVTRSATVMRALFPEEHYGQTDDIKPEEVSSLKQMQQAAYERAIHDLREKNKVPDEKAARILAHEARIRQSNAQKEDPDVSLDTAQRNSTPPDTGEPYIDDATPDASSERQPQQPKDKNPISRDSHDVPGLGGGGFPTYEAQPELGGGTIYLKASRGIGGSSF